MTSFHLLTNIGVSILFISCLIVVQLLMGRIMDQGPVLVISFQAQVVMVIRGPKGDLVEGDPVSRKLIIAMATGTDYVL